MTSKNMILLLDAHQNYVTEHNYPLFQAISGTYIPLLNMLRSLENDGVQFQLALVLSAPLCTMLTDPFVQQQYIEWLDKRIDLGHRELERCRDSVKFCNEVKICLEKVKQDKIDFTEIYGQNLVKHFSEYAKKGYLELLATTGTRMYIPHYSDMPEVLNAQIEIGLYAHKYFFGVPSNGFWLPYLGYVSGVEKVLRNYGIDYTVLDSRSMLFAEPEPKNGIFGPARFENSVVMFGRDPESQLTGLEYFASNPVYRDQNRDIGFDLRPEDLSSFYREGSGRQPTGFRYWHRGGADIQSDSLENTEFLYDYEKASEQAELDAAAFLDRKSRRLSEAAGLLDTENVSLVCAYDANILGQQWFEGVYWLEQVIRKSASAGITCTGFSSLLKKKGSLLSYQKLVPYPASAAGDGYGEQLLDNTNSWMVRYAHKACERMVDLADLFPSETGLKARLLNLGARELLLSLSAEWAEMIHDGTDPAFAARRFKEGIVAFTMVFDSLGSNTVSTEWLTNLEQEHPIFPWMNYRIFCKKH